MLTIKEKDETYKAVDMNGIEFFIYQHPTSTKDPFPDEAIKEINDQWFLFQEDIGFLDLFVAAGYSNIHGHTDSAYPVEWRRSNPEVDKRIQSGDHPVIYYGGNNHLGEPLWVNDAWTIVLKELREALETNTQDVKSPAMENQAMVA